MRKYFPQFVLSAVLALTPLLSTADQYDDMNVEIRMIATRIKQSGPLDLRQIPYSTIESSVRTFVIGRRMGIISKSEIARMGGAQGAAESSLRGDLRATGQIVRGK